MPVSILPDLVDAALLTVGGNPTVNWENLTFCQRPVMKLLKRLMCGARSLREIGPDARPFEALAQAMPRFGCWAAVVMELAKEHLIRFGWEKQTGPRIGMLWVSSDDLDFQLEVVSDDRSFLSLASGPAFAYPVAVLMSGTFTGVI